jgi:hypothetical protein
MNSKLNEVYSVGTLGSLTAGGTGGTGIVVIRYVA